MVHSHFCFVPLTLSKISSSKICSYDPANLPEKNPGYGPVFEVDCLLLSLIKMKINIILTISKKYFTYNSVILYLDLFWSRWLTIILECSHPFTWCVVNVILEDYLPYVTVTFITCMSYPITFVWSWLSCRFIQLAHTKNNRYICEFEGSVLKRLYFFWCYSCMYFL